MKYLLCFSVILISLSISAARQAQKGEAAKVSTVPSLLVEVEGGKSLNLKAADLAKLPRRDVKAKDHDGKESAYSGIELREILQLAEVKFGKDLRGAGLAGFLVVEAVDTYWAVFALPELDKEFTDKVVILADQQDAKPLSEKHGPWQIIVPDEKRHGRWVRQVNALKIKTVK